jgi:uncharacterized protein YndB with AHSA1/START domain
MVATTESHDQAGDDRSLAIARHIDAPPSALWRCWTEPELITRWFVPPPWSVARAEINLRPGGTCLVVMRDAEGNEMPSPGVYLEVVPERRLVSTDAYVRAWVPAARPFMTLELTFAPAENGGTDYLARALHWTKEAREEHERMGFQEGWTKTTNQLAALGRTIAGKGDG